MFDIGWPELMIVAVITILVVGPKELPRVLRTVTMWIRRIREMAMEFQAGLDDLAREAELEEIQKEFAETTPENLMGDVEQSIASHLDVEEELDDIKGTLEDGSKPKSDKSPPKQEPT
ncbi:MAG TPA: twin-arginine translocase subunit TatB [Rhodospirillaceae bacterium]|nr:twin-arginine translocase subunit TatB [Rhodospirillaceae bacterium]HAT34549.1 twin-arginine translocase subunit TatB [Rhodospirillaceae bacterium]|tara:strand:- start:601 stop:954 length:354 start_codon:yes stop_codon:yes gene_type:complete